MIYKIENVYNKRYVVRLMYLCMSDVLNDTSYFVVFALNSGILL